MSREGQSTQSERYVSPISPRGKVVLDVDLNALPASSCFTLNTSDSFNLPSQAVSTRGKTSQKGIPIIDVDTSDDDGVLVVPASNQSMNISVIDIPDDDSDDQASPDVAARALLHISSSNSKFQNTRGKNIIKCDIHVTEKAKEPEQLKEPNLLCAVCKGELVNATTTICGHIFCEKCIKAAIRAQKKCPTCRTRLSMRKIHRSTSISVIDIANEDSDEHASPGVAARTLLRISSSNSKLQNTWGKNILKCDIHVTEKAKEPEQPKGPILLCEVCKGELVNATTTSCGHIFCEKCIKAAIRAQKKCPTCRTRLTMRKIHRSASISVIDIANEDSDEHASPGVAARTLLRISSSNSKHKNTRGKNIIKRDIHVTEKAKEPEQPKEPNLLCAICKGELVNATSTSCGHIFCEKCIKAAIREQKKCPTCRTHLTVRKIHRVYLPTC